MTDDRLPHVPQLVPGPLIRGWGEVTPDRLAGLLTTPPRLPVPAADDPAWAHADPATLAVLSSDAGPERATPWPRPTATQFARYFRDGDRLDYEGRIAACQRRLSRAVVLSAAGERPGRVRWLDEVTDGIVVLCELSSWCWAAHEGTVAAKGTVVPDVDDPFVDLGAGEIASQLAWADHVLGAALDEYAPGVRARLRRELRRRVLDPFLDRDDWHWLGYDGNVHNWCPWICGNIIAAAVVTGTDAVETAGWIAKAVAGIDRFLGALPPDGSIDEGYDYWWQGACRALEALDLLAHATGGALDASAIGVVRETLRFPHRMHLGGEWYVNVADGQARPSRHKPWHVLHRWARRVGDRDALAHAEAQRAPGAPVATASDGLGRLLGALHDHHWASAPRCDPPLVASAWLPGSEVGVAREAAGTADGLAVAVKGGHNDEHHNHNDVGSVIVATDGVPALVDAGRPTYTAQTFGPNRYDIWTMQSSWHNVPEVRGTPQGQGAAFRATGVQVTDTPERFTVGLDLARAYPIPPLLSWWRTVDLDRTARRVTIGDSWSFADEPPEDAPTTIRYLLSGSVEQRAAGELVAQPIDAFRPVRLTWDPQLATATTVVRELDDPILRDVWGDHLTRLDLRVPAMARGALTLTVEIIG